MISRYNTALNHAGAATSPTDSSDLVVRPSTKLLKPLYALAGALIVMVYISNSERGDPQYWWLILPLAILAWTGARHLARRFTTLTLSGHRLRYETGMLSKTTRTLEVRKVQDVRVDCSLGQRMLGTGDITIETAGETSRLTMSSIDRPQQVADRILDAAHR